MPPPPRERRRKSLRLPDYDYSGAGPYFVTVCTYRRECSFGTITDHEMRPNALGDIVAACWRDLPVHYPATRLDEFVVMPNHVHGIVVLNQDDGSDDRLSELVRAFKAFSTRRINQLGASPELSLGGRPVWQRGYYEHVIRTEASLAQIRRYVVSNPAQWGLDENNPERRG
jgi:putative transposase